MIIPNASVVRALNLLSTPLYLNHASFKLLAAN